MSFDDRIMGTEPAECEWIEKSREMRNAIDAMELAMMGWPELIDLPGKWGNPRHRKELGCKIPATCGQVYRVCDALAELTRIINSPEYVPPRGKVIKGLRV